MSATAARTPAQGDGAGAARAAVGGLDRQPGRRQRAPGVGRRAPGPDPPGRHQRARRRRSRRRRASPTAACSPPGSAAPTPTQIVSTASTSGIPSAALAAYQRAETVINAADKTCNLTWQLIAAIGRVESNHGRANGNTLDDNGLATPGIYGIALNGSNSTTEIVDTDAGQYDNDTAYDRAVGPMQFIPSTWSVVGVDADGDGVRNPQDIDDAALGTAVYLCSGCRRPRHRRRPPRARSSATTTASPTSTSCSRSWTPTCRATSPPSPTAP